MEAGLLEKRGSEIRDWEDEYAHKSVLVKTCVNLLAQYFYRCFSAQRNLATKQFTGLAGEAEIKVAREAVQRQEF